MVKFFKPFSLGDFKTDPRTGFTARDVVLKVTVDRQKIPGTEINGQRVTVVPFLTYGNSKSQLHGRVLGEDEIPIFKEMCAHWHKILPALEEEGFEVYAVDPPGGPRKQIDQKAAIQVVQGAELNEDDGPLLLAQETYMLPPKGMSAAQIEATLRKVFSYQGLKFYGMPGGVARGGGDETIIGR